MEKLPLKLNISEMIENINHLSEIKSIKLLKNLFQYKKEGIITASDLIRIGMGYKVSIGELTIQLLSIDDEDKLIKFCEFISDLSRFGFIENIFLLRKIANQRLKKIYEEK
ncbi:hypothetical protein [Bergeyella zoohelcum]|uniref:EF-hand domain-containing protein n=2 Tax=Bergeyella zoohelcum TaxID=1015 RepID=K1LP98_9FLAO|nr:hypothetical protein [Bergeyella zoohelcum]EKB56566.1 hypothetical protein HMPREF9699_01295 [Bergeyella zoohelcum ATCC 43767]SUV48526.1 Uncharacterised protein [Bergeyella zoohelcum]VDH05834.1 Uncharacterised protein [Bergeyella zoohelcum]